jgi:hypothetical protein
MELISGMMIDVEIEFYHQPYEKATWDRNGGTPEVTESFDDIQVISPGFRGKYITQFLTYSQKQWADEKVKKYLQREKEKAEEVKHDSKKHQNQNSKRVIFLL